MTINTISNPSPQFAQIENKANKILSLCANLDSGNVKKVCAYIEANREEWQKKLQQIRKERGCLHYSKKITKLDFTVQVNKNQKVYILLGKKGHIGKGSFKRVAKAIEYDTLRVVAYAVTRINTRTAVSADREIKYLSYIKDLDDQDKDCIVEYITGCFYYDHKLSYKQCLIFKYYNSKDLSSLLEKKLDISSKLSIAADIICGVALLHRKNIVHQDLKPENILIESKENNEVSAAIADIAFATIAYKDTPMHNVGTPYYMSPERFSTGRIYGWMAYASDIWALGTILYQLFYGKPPPWMDFMDNCNLDLSKNPEGFAEGIIKSVLELYPEPKLENGLDHLIWEMVRPDPQDRPSIDTIIEKISLLSDKKKVNSKILT